MFIIDTLLIKKRYYKLFPIPQKHTLNLLLSNKTTLLKFKNKHYYYFLLVNNNKPQLHTKQTKLYFIT